MKSKRLFLLAVVACACALALFAAVGCAAPASSSASSSNGASAASASSAASSGAAASFAASSAASSAAQLMEEAAIAQGYQVFKGTVRVLDGPSLIELQGIDIDPAAAGGGGTYAVLVFDQPTDVTGESADGSGQRTEPVKMLGIAEYTSYSGTVIEYGDLELCKGLDCQQATLAAKATDIMFPSDVRLPIGQPSARAVVML